MVVQVIAVRYANRELLTSLLAAKFNGQATFTIRRGSYVITAPRNLTQEEIDTCR